MAVQIFGHLHPITLVDSDGSVDVARLQWPYLSPPDLIVTQKARKDIHHPKLIKSVKRSLLPQEDSAVADVLHRLFARSRL